MNNIVKMLDVHNIPSNLIQNNEGGQDISCSHNLKEYIIKQQENNTYKLLESNLYGNPRRKNRHHEVDNFQDAGEIVEFIKNRKFYMVS